MKKIIEALAVGLCTSVFIMIAIFILELLFSFSLWEMLVFNSLALYRFFGALFFILGFIVSFTSYLEEDK